jgi:ARG and Rhodanese-Phosphatase-superfamily-associated Protein domain
MKSRFSFIFTLICLLTVVPLGLLISAQVRQKQSNKDTVPGANRQVANYRLSGPYTHKNLTIFLVHGKNLVAGHNFLTLQEALAQKKVIVYETKDVNELAIKNLSSEDIYVQAGDIVKGGDQDRMISVDFIVPPKSGRMPIAAFCVESGRWNRRGGEVSASFGSSENVVATKDLKLAAKRSNSQQAVWENVTLAQDKLTKNVGARVNSSVSDSSLVLAVENPKVQESAANYVKALSGILNNHTDAIGYVFAINGHINSADVYSSSALFAKLWPKLLKSNAIEAIAELQTETKSATVSDDAVLGFLAEAGGGSGTEQVVTPRVKILTRENDKSIFFETRDRNQKEAWIHRNYIIK